MRKIFILQFILILVFTQLKAESFNENSKNSIAFSSGYSEYQAPQINYSRSLGKNNWITFGIGYHGSFDHSDPTENRYQNDDCQHSFIASVGIEKRRLIGEKIEFTYGIDLLFQNRLRKLYVGDPNKPERLRTTITQNIEYGFDFNLGLFYNISNNFSVGSKLIPNLWIMWLKENQILNTRFDLTNHSVLSLRYCF